ncbi:MAG: N-acetylglucosamine kinase [Acidimicrobiales bacterium]
MNPRHPDEERLALGVDGGASKTDVWLVDGAGSLIGSARGDGCNHQFSGMDAAMDALDAAIASACAAAGRGGALPVADTGAFCLAGVDFAVDEERLGREIATRGWCVNDIVQNDTLAVLRAGARSGWGVGVVCGSGINCAGLGPDGSVERFPSLAELSGDFAPGGSWLGVRALGLALRSRDGRGGPTSLAELVPAHFGLADPESVLESVYTGAIGYGRLFELARVCLDAAGQGDEASGEAVGILADEVGVMVTAMIARLGVADRPVEVVLGGGVFDTAYEGLADRVRRKVHEVAPKAELGRLAAPPVLGAALLALEASGGSPEAEEHLRSTAATMGTTAGAEACSSTER